jgi:DNA polymerase III subunit delta'
MKEVYPWQEGLWERWIELRSRLPHALLLKGPQGTGKLDFAMNISQAMLCESPNSRGMACDSCSSCHWFLQGSHPDFRLIQPEALTDSVDAPNEENSKKKSSQQISVDQIRALSDFSNLSSHRGGYRVVLIHPSEAMNISAANALLKMLEEPSEGMLFILVAHKFQHLLPTIISRCLTIATAMPSPDVSIKWLEQKGISNPMNKLAWACFAPLQVIRMESGSDISIDFQSLFDSLERPDTLDATALAEQLQRTEPAKVILWLQQWCYDLISVKLTGTSRFMQEKHKSLASISANSDLIELLRFQKELKVAKREAQHPLNAGLLFESLLLSYRQTVMGS